MMKQLLTNMMEMVRKLFRSAWEQFKVFWFTIAVPWLKALTPKKALKLAGIAFLAGVLFIALLFYVLSFNLPTVESLKDYKPSPGTTIYAEDGRVLGRVQIEKGTYVPITRVPKFMKDALLATEDPRFYQHSGIDYRGILRAALKNIISVRVAQGGSTITQQLTKVVFLSPERKITRKIKEIILARRLEKELDKDEILELYLNKVYFGHGAYGVQMAAKTYFGKNIWEVNQAEAALLAGLPKSPAAYSPYSDIDLTKLRQWHVLKRMVAEGYLTEEQSRKVYDQPISLENLRPQEELAPHLVDYLRKYIEKKYGEDMLYQGGLKVYTSIDLDLQHQAVTALREGLRALDKRQGFRGKVGYKPVKSTPIQWGSLHVMVKPGEGFNAHVLAVNDDSVTVKGRGLLGFIMKDDMAWALIKPKKNRESPDEFKKPAEIVQVGDIIKVRLKDYDKKNQVASFVLDQTPLVQGAVVSIEPYTGYVRAMVGGYDFVEGGFNHATDAKRQPGSSFKPFVYGAALENGFTPASILMDLPQIYEKSEFEKKTWKPTNYDERFLGPMRMRTALALSRNAVTVGLLEKIGLDKAIDFARKAGITSHISYDYTTALGSSVVTPLELTSAYATFASQGYRSEPIIIMSIVDGKGTVLESYQPDPKEAIDRTTAYLVTSLLKSVVQEGTGRGALSLGRPLAGKTGTTNNYVDAWFLGYSPDIVTGVWVGYDNPKASLGDRETGARAALPIWISVMARAMADKPAEDFVPADDVVFVKIDPETGLLARDGAPDAITDVFRKGTEPTQYADAKKSQQKTGLLYNVEQGGEDTTTKKKLPADEVSD
ncbi:MAG TPA: PBP1A family penicillin-binding protein [Nitrospirota bacterium]|nr:PBP1A family penicillin-binding protein [Nitrospirota bacterium]